MVERRCQGNQRGVVYKELNIRGYLLQLCPLWLAPNLITFVGFLMLLSIFFLVWYFDPDYLTTSNDIGTPQSLPPSSSLSPPSHISSSSTSLYPPLFLSYPSCFLISLFLPPSLCCICDSWCFGALVVLIRHAAVIFICVKWFELLTGAIVMANYVFSPIPIITELQESIHTDITNYGYIL